MTAEQLFGKHFDGLHYDDITPERIEKYAIEFAKFHVECALLSAAEEAELNIIGISDAGIEYDGVDKQSILNAYPTDNIK